MRTLPCIDPWGKFEEILLLPDDGLIEVIFRYRKKKSSAGLDPRRGVTFPDRLITLLDPGKLLFLVRVIVVTFRRRCSIDRWFIVF